MIDLKPYNLIYLATPYDAHPGGHAEAWRDTCTATAALLRRGVPVFSPILHFHHTSARVSYSREQWLALDERFMAVCGAIVVAMLPGWGVSHGIDHEITYFKKRGRPIAYFDMKAETLLTYQPFPEPPAGAAP